MTGPTRDPGRMVLEHGPDGLRAKEWGPEPDVAHWERLWAGTDPGLAAARAGHLPRQLRTTFAALVPPPARVLEAGCGPAAFTVALRSLGYDAVGLDWAAATLARVHDEVPAVVLCRGDVRRSPFADGSFDAVYSPGVCEHFEGGPDAVLLDLRRVLRPGGLAVVSTPHLDALRRRRWSRADRRTVGADGAPFYQYLFTVDGMTRTLHRLGFEDVRATPYGAWATLAAHWPTLGRIPLGRTAGAADLVPALRRLGSSCIWTARKPVGDRPPTAPRATVPVAVAPAAPFRHDAARHDAAGHDAAGHDEVGHDEVGHDEVGRR